MHKLHIMHVKLIYYELFIKLGDVLLKNVNSRSICGPSGPITLALLVKGFKLSDEISQVLVDEVIRSCFIEPTKQRSFLLAGQPDNSSVKDLQEEPVILLNRVFDVTAAQNFFSHDIIELKKIASLGFDLSNSLLIHLHPKKYNTTPSLLDAIVFLLTDTVVGKPLTYAVIGFEDTKPVISFLRFKECIACPFSYKKLLNNPPLFDFKEVNV